MEISKRIIESAADSAATLAAKSMLPTTAIYCEDYGAAGIRWIEYRPAICVADYKPASNVKVAIPLVTSFSPRWFE